MLRKCVALEIGSQRPVEDPLPIVENLILDILLLIDIKADIPIRRLDVFPELIDLLDEVDFDLLLKISDDGFFVIRLRLIRFGYQTASVGYRRHQLCIVVLLETSGDLIVECMPHDLSLPQFIELEGVIGQMQSGQGLILRVPLDFIPFSLVLESPHEFDVRTPIVLGI